MSCIFTTDVKSGKATTTVRAFDEEFGKWVYLQTHFPHVGLGYMESISSLELAQAAAIGAALIAAAKAAGWDEAVPAVREEPSCRTISILEKVPSEPTA